MHKPEYNKILKIENVKYQRQWVGKGETPAAQAKVGLHPDKLSPVWWDMKGFVCFEFLNLNQMITKEDLLQAT